MSNTRKPKNKQPAGSTASATTSPQGEAGQAEVKGVETVTIRWRDLTPFEVPRYRMDWPFEAVVAAEEQRWPSMLAALLPAVTRAEFATMGCTQRDAYNLLNTISDGLGFEDVGE